MILSLRPFSLPHSCPFLLSQKTVILTTASPLSLTSLAQRKKVPPRPPRPAPCRCLHPPPFILHLLLFPCCTLGHASPLAVLLYSFPNGAMQLSPWYLVFHYLLASINDIGHLKPLFLMILLCYRCGRPWSVIHYRYSTCLIYISNSNDRLILIYFSCTLLLL